MVGPLTIIVLQLGWRKGTDRCHRSILPVGRRRGINCDEFKTLFFACSLGIVILF